MKLLQKIEQLNAEYLASSDSRHPYLMLNDALKVIEKQDELIAQTRHALQVLVNLKNKEANGADGKIKAWDDARIALFENNPKAAEF